MKNTKSIFKAGNAITINDRVVFGVAVQPEFNSSINLVKYELFKHGEQIDEKRSYNITEDFYREFEVKEKAFVYTIHVNLFEKKKGAQYKTNYTGRQIRIHLKPPQRLIESTDTEGSLKNKSSNLANR